MICQIVPSLLYFSSIVVAQYTPSPRWGQAAALLESKLYVHGGLSDPFNSYSYSSAPEISDLLLLDLSTSFNSSSPPWKLLSASASPALAWHTLSAFDPSQLFLFGGQLGPDSATVLTTLNDSSGLLTTSTKSGPSFATEPNDWANQPMRRIRHSASYTDGKVWIIGGEEADGSGNAFRGHYSFDPSGPAFVQLPSSPSAPPDIYGHTSVVLPNGQLLVLGGYCASCSELAPMNTVWALNTTQDPPLWEMVAISNTSLPNPRRDFASVVLANGWVLIHGGGDAQLQTTYSDGWVLDTSQNPMVWSSVAALGQLGPRKDHFAVQAGGYVFFCFGYGSSSPASASLFIYNPSTSSIVTSYTAPPPGSTPAITSLPASAQTGSNSNSNPNGATGTVSLGSSPGSPSNTSGVSSSSSDDATAIALGTVFGVLGLVLGGLATIYYVRRVRNRDRRASGRFFPLSDDPELSSLGGSFGAATPEAPHLDVQLDGGPREFDNQGVITQVLAQFGISRFSSTARQPRRDMFADEDTRSFGVGNSSTLHREGSEGTSWSFRSVGALVRGVMGRETSGSEADQGKCEYEKMDHLHEEDQGLIHPAIFHDSTSSRPSHRREESFWSYTDPFEDRTPDDEYDITLRPGTPEKDADYDRPVLRSGGTDDLDWPTLGPQDLAWPFSVRSRILTPLREASQISLSEPSNSITSLQEPLQITSSQPDNPVLSSPANVSPSCHSLSPLASRSSDLPPITNALRYSTTSSSTLSHSPSSTRPDSWWSRLTKSPLIDRRTSFSSKPLDFRDPTPAPPLIVSEGTKTPSTIPTSSSDTTVDQPVVHGRTVSSAHSGRTANTDLAEHLGDSHDVVQRLASDGSSSRRAPSPGSVEVTEEGASGVDNSGRSEIALADSSSHADPPRSTSPPADLAMSTEEETPTKALMSPKSNPTTPRGGALVSSRIKAYERRLSQEIEPLQTSPRNTRRREEVPSRTRPTIQYGVAPRPSLLIANPDSERH